MDTNTIDEAKVAQLPKDGVHCFAANSKQINVRRVITIPLMVITLVLGIFFLLGKYQSVPLSFLIAKYRIAVDYNEKKIILRYRYSLITIPFETFDAREGEPDRAEALLENSQLGGNEKVYYLVLDNVLDDACYQTTTKDLATKEDFFKLKAEVFAIAEAYGARNLENAIRPEGISNAEVGGAKETTDDDISNIVSSVMNGDEAPIEKDVQDVEEFGSDAVEKAEEVAEAVEEKADEVKGDD